MAGVTIIYKESLVTETMDGPYLGSFASANFSDDNVAGSGSSEFRAISNLRTVHMMEANIWNRPIQTLFEMYEESWLDHMVPPVEDLDRSKQLQTILKKLSHPMFNPSASWIPNEITSPVHRDKIEADITSGIGISPIGFQSTIQSLHTMYQSTVHKMFELDSVLQGRLKQVEDLHTQLSSLPALSPDLSATSTLQTSISHYTEQFLEASNVHKEYPVFLHTVGCFHQLRSLLKSSMAFQEKKLRNPCMICMEKEIEFVTVPCGHPFCPDCVKKTRSICFLCRTPVVQKQKIYF
jgi:hypothetical protein